MDRSHSEMAHDIPKPSFRTTGFRALSRIVLLAMVLLTAGCSQATNQSSGSPAPAAPQGEAISPSSSAGPSEVISSAMDAAVSTTPIESSHVRFTEIANQLGIHFTRYNDFRGQHRILEANGGGCGILDFDGDGWPDLLLIDGCRYPEQDDQAAHHDRLYRSIGGQEFQDVTNTCGLQSHGYHTGCASGDLNNDGFADLVITAVDGVYVIFNNGDGTLSHQADALPPLDARWSTSVACADLNGDGQLDLYIVNYVADDPANPRLCPAKGSPDGFLQCSPTQFAAQDDWLLIGDDRGHWLDVTAEAGITGIDGKGLGVLITDLTGDGLLDIYVANDGTPNFLYVRQPGTAISDDGIPLPRFEEQAMTYGCAVNAAGQAESSMGITAGDYDRDRDTDLHLTNFFAEPNVLYRNLQNTGFEDTTIESRLAAASRRTMGWGTVFFDADNDGWLDLFVANGHVDDYTWAGAGEPYAIPPQFFLNLRNGTFADVSSQCGDGFRIPGMGRGVVAGDLNQDGLIDVVVNDTTGPSPVWQNETKVAHHWLGLRLVGSGASNRSAIGSRIEISDRDGVQMRTLDGGGSFQSAGPPELHFGFGAANEVSHLTVRWPSGAISEFHDIAIDRELILIEGHRLLLASPSATRQ